MRSTRSKPLKRPTETSSYIPTWDIGFSEAARKTGPILKPLRLKGPLMTRIIVSVIKSAVFILGIVLASCFIGRGANSRMKHVVGVQQRFIAHRDRKINRW
nr:MAG TPA: hypothetical protein [Caudoviricetes sp.]